MTVTPATYTSPIIFSAPMIRALLADQKVQTRRLITSQWSNVKMHHELSERCLLWVREAWQLHSRATDLAKVVYRASERASNTEFHQLVPTAKLGNAQPRPFQEGWKPSIHMPRWASRLTLELTDVRVQRLQDISEADAIAEGIEPVFDQGRRVGWKSYDQYEIGHFVEAVTSYETLWESLHGEGSWAANPEIIAMTFRVHRRNVDAVIGRAS